MKKLTQQKCFKRNYFPLSKELGYIKSFKVTRYSDKLQKAVKELKKYCMLNLSHGATKTLKKGIKLVVESPVYMPDWAKLNIDRKVPIRQYYGMDMKVIDNKTVSRWCYGVGSGTSTVGGDNNTTVTQSLTTEMKEIISLLETEELLKCKGAYCNKGKVRYNHVTILYYLLDSKSVKEVVLNPHCDVEINTMNKASQSNSQKPDTPTTIISFGCSKAIKIYKRYVDNNKFSKAKEVDSLQIHDEDIFVLHPHDERVLNRMEERKSQFQHGVKCNMIKRSKNRRHHEFQVGISVCFRQSQVCLNLSR